MEQALARLAVSSSCTWAARAGLRAATYHASSGCRGDRTPNATNVDSAGTSQSCTTADEIQDSGSDGNDGSHIRDEESMDSEVEGVEVDVGDEGADASPENIANTSGITTKPGIVCL